MQLYTVRELVKIQSALQKQKLTWQIGMRNDVRTLSGLLSRPQSVSKVDKIRNGWPIKKCIWLPIIGAAKQTLIGEQNKRKKKPILNG